MVRNTAMSKRIISLTLCLWAFCASQGMAKDKDDPQIGRAGNWRHNAQGAPSVEACRKKVAADPKDAEAQNDLGWALRQNGDLNGAEAALRESIKLKDDQPFAHSNLSVVLLDKGKKEEALQEAKRAATLDSKNPIYHVVYGNAMLANGDAKGAIAEYKTAIGQRSDYENAYYNLGRALHEDGQTLEAKLALGQAIDLDPDDVRAMNLLDAISK